MKRKLVGWASSVITSAFIALLCWFVLKFFMCLLVQFDSRWRHVSFWWDVHRLHVGDMSCLNVSVGNVLVCSAVMWSAYNSTMRILGYPGGRATILTCNGPLKTMAPAMLTFPSPSSDVNESFV